MLVGLCALFCSAQAQAADVFAARADLTLADLESAVQRGAPVLEAARRELALARADVRQSRTFANPTLDAAWGTIPLGTTNPPELADPLRNVPNYEVGLSYTIPVRKRRPRIQQAEAVARGAQAELDARAREGALALAEVMGRLATASLRRDGMAELVQAGRRSVELARARVAAQFAAPLDVDRLEIETQRLEQALSGAEGQIRAELAACTALTALPCRNFADGEEARRYLAHWLARDSTAARRIEARPDLRALRAYAEAAGFGARLARAQALPDPTVRLGYTHDRFLVSGNHQNSLSLSVSVPLPLFERGQAQQRAAEATRHHLQVERARRTSLAEPRAASLAERLQVERTRCQRVSRELIPSARSVVQSLESASEQRLLALTDVIQARRTLVELFIEEAESCGDAYAAAIALLQEIYVEGATL